MIRFQPVCRALLRCGLSVCVCAALALVGCSDDETFTLDRSALLSFEQDTLSFDTVFSSVGSSTKRMRVYNRHNDGIRILSARLGSGGTSGFRINVDGHGGTDITDVEVAGGDSVFMFVDVTVDPHDSDSPVLVRDSVIFSLESGAVQKIYLEAYGQDIIVLRGTVFETDTTLSSGRPYLIYDSLVVAAGHTLELSAGTVLCFHSGAYLGVHGRVVCQGETDNMVVLRGDRTDKIFTYLPYDRMDSQWGGVTIYAESSGNVFDGVDIHGGNWGINCLLSDTTEEKILIRNSSVGNVSGHALRLFNVKATAYNSLFWNAGGSCVDIVGGSSDFVHCTLAQFYPWDSDYQGALYFANCVGDTIYPLHRAAFANCVLTGRVADAIVGYPSENSDAAFAASFDHCLVNMDLPDDSPAYVREMFATATNEYDLFPSKSATHPDTTKIYGAKNFADIDDDIYFYDFRLDSLSNARNIGDPSCVTICPRDLDGKERDAEHPDAGCYEY